MFFHEDISFVGFGVFERSLELASSLLQFCVGGQILRMEPLRGRLEDAALPSPTGNGLLLRTLDRSWIHTLESLDWGPITWHMASFQFDFSSGTVIVDSSLLIAIHKLGRMLRSVGRSVLPRVLGRVLGELLSRVVGKLLSRVLGELLSRVLGELLSDREQACISL